MDLPPPPIVSPSIEGRVCGYIACAQTDHRIKQPVEVRGKVMLAGQDLPDVAVYCINLLNFYPIFPGAFPPPHGSLQ